jgi:hypothetical protein
MECSAALGGKGLVQAPHHHRFDGGQELGHGEWRDAQRPAQCQCRTHVPADHRFGQDAELAAEALREVPDLPAVECKRPVQPDRAVRALPLAGVAVAFASAVGPLGEGDEAFFSCSRSRPLAT